MFYKFYDVFMKTTYTVNINNIIFYDPIGNDGTVLVHLIGGKTIRVKANALSFLEGL